MNPTPEEIEKARLEFRMRDTVNQLYLLATLISDHETAERFNSEATTPLFKLRRRFEMRSGRTIKVPR